MQSTCYNKTEIRWYYEKTFPKNIKLDLESFIFAIPPIYFNKEQRKRNDEATIRKITKNK